MGEDLKRRWKGDGQPALGSQGSRRNRRRRGGLKGKEAALRRDPESTWSAHGTFVGGERQHPWKVGLMVMGLVSNFHAVIFERRRRLAVLGGGRGKKSSGKSHAWLLNRARRSATRNRAGSGRAAQTVLWRQAGGRRISTEC